MQKSSFSSLHTSLSVLRIALLIIFRNPKITSLILHSQFLTRVVLMTGIRTYLAVQWLRLHAYSARGVGSIPGQGTRSHMLCSSTKRNGSAFLPVPISVAQFPLFISQLTCWDTLSGFLFPPVLLLPGSLTPSTLPYPDGFIPIFALPGLQAGVWHSWPFPPSGNISFSWLSWVWLLYLGLFGWQLVFLCLTSKCLEVLNSLLFSICTLSQKDPINSLGFQFHLYADNSLDTYICGPDLSLSLKLVYPAADLIFH